MRTDTTYIRICAKAFDSVERLMASGAYSLPEWTTWSDTTTPRTDRPVRFFRATSRIVGATHPTVWSYIA